MKMKMFQYSPFPLFTSYSQKHGIFFWGSSTVVCLRIATAFGKGVYFAHFFCYSAQHVYSMPDRNKNKYIFQCRVLTGSYCSGQPELMEPPARDKKSLALYDSVVDVPKNPSVFVIFQDHQAYPEYLVTFQAWSNLTVTISELMSPSKLFLYHFTTQNWQLGRLQSYDILRLFIVALSLILITFLAWSNLRHLWASVLQLFVSVQYSLLLTWSTIEL